MLFNIFINSLNNDVKCAIYVQLVQLTIVFIVHNGKHDWRSCLGYVHHCSTSLIMSFPCLGKEVQYVV